MIDVRSDKGSERTESGLIVPAGTVEKKRQRWTWDAWKKIDRGIRAMAEGGGIMAILFCNACGKRFTAERTETGFKMECPCTVHEVIRKGN